MRKLFLIVLVAVIGTQVIALAKSEKDFIPVSSGVKYQLLGTYDVAKLNSILTKDAETFSSYKVTYPEAKNAVKLYRVTYNSVIPELNNKPTVASGLLAIPEGVKGEMPVLSYQHGTVFGKTDVPSFPDESSEIRLIVANFAANGYVVIAADNFGKGTSTENDAYQIKQSTQQADIDMLFASRKILKSLKIQEGSLFISGWSMGSWSTLMFLQKLQSLDISVKAAAIACNPNDVFALVNSWIHVPSKIDAAWLPAILALQLNSYSQFYNLSGLPQAAIKTEYQQAASDYYHNKINYDTFYARTTSKISEFLKPEFINASSLGQGQYWKLIQENSSYRFRSLTPINVYYGEVDEAIPVYISTLPQSYQEAIGGVKVTTISAGEEADHRGTYKFSIQHSKVWFDSLLKEK